MLKKALVEYQVKDRRADNAGTVLTSNRNAGLDDARALIRWVSPLKAQVNLIPWNVVPGLPFEEPTSAQVKAFSDLLEKAGLVAVQRMHRGRGVMGACGQLGDTLLANPKSE